MAAEIKTGKLEIKGVRTVVEVPMYVGDKLLRENAKVECIHYGTGPIPVFMSPSRIYGPEFVKQLLTQYPQYTFYDLDPFFTLGGVAPPLTQEEIAQFQSPADIARFYEEARKKLGLGPIVMMGMSALGFVAVEFFKKYPHSTHQAVMVGTPPYFSFVAPLSIAYPANEEEYVKSLAEWKTNAFPGEVYFIFSHSSSGGEWHAYWSKKGGAEFERVVIPAESPCDKELRKITDAENIASFDKSGLTTELLKNLFPNYISPDFPGMGQKFMQANFDPAVHDTFIADVKGEAERKTSGIATPISRVKWETDRKGLAAFFALTGAGGNGKTPEALYLEEWKAFLQRLQLHAKAPLPTEGQELVNLEAEFHKMWDLFNLQMRGQLFGKMVQGYVISIPPIPGKLSAITGIADGVAPFGPMFDYMQHRFPGLCQCRVVEGQAHDVQSSPEFVRIFHECVATASVAVKKEGASLEPKSPAKTFDHSIKVLVASSGGSGLSFSYAAKEVEGAVGGNTQKSATLVTKDRSVEEVDSTSPKV